LLIAAAYAALTACTPEIERKPVDFTPRSASDSTGIHTFTKEVTFSPALGFSRTIAAGSQWRLIGRVPNGEVYRPISGVFTVESAQVHESGIVIWQGKLTGFYMLVERAFVPLDPPISVQLLPGDK
jgi:hypothetical protein